MGLTFLGLITATAFQIKHNDSKIRRYIPGIAGSLRLCLPVYSIATPLAVYCIYSESCEWRHVTAEVHYGDQKIARLRLHVETADYDSRKIRHVSSTAVSVDRD